MPTIETRPIDRLIPYVRNARTHSEDQIAQIAASIAGFGFVNPVADRRRGRDRSRPRPACWRAKRLGIAEAPVIEPIGEARDRGS